MAAHIADSAHKGGSGAPTSNHGETGHPTPDGMRRRLSGDPLVTKIVVSEIETHGTSAWDHLLLGVVVHCLEQQLEPATIVPVRHAKAVGTAEGEWRKHERLNLTWPGRQGS